MMIYCELLFKWKIDDIDILYILLSTWFYRINGPLTDDFRGFTVPTPTVIFHADVEFPEDGDSN